MALVTLEISAMFDRALRIEVTYDTGAAGTTSPAPVTLIEYWNDSPISATYHVQQGGPQTARDATIPAGPGVHGTFTTQSILRRYTFSNKDDGTGAVFYSPDFDWSSGN